MGSVLLKELLSATGSVKADSRTHEPHYDLQSTVNCRLLDNFGEAFINSDSFHCTWRNFCKCISYLKGIDMDRNYRYSYFSNWEQDLVGRLDDVQSVVLVHNKPD